MTSTMMTSTNEENPASHVLPIGQGQDLQSTIAASASAPGPTDVPSVTVSSHHTHSVTAVEELAGRYPVWKLVVWILFLGVVGIVLALFRAEIFGTQHTLVPTTDQSSSETNTPWDGLVTITSEAQSAIGVTTQQVVSQTDPMLLPILGTTKHDETKLTKVLPLFKGRAERVYVSVGDHVDAGSPLVDLYSADLAQAKTNYEIEKTQWDYVRRLLSVRTELRKENSISEQVFLETKNDELRQHHEFDIAREKLILFGLTDSEIDSVAAEQGARRARLTVRSPAAGVVISRNVVSGNIYDDSDVMLVIAPNDHLWVWGNVFERDLGLVSLEQKWDVQFSFLDEHLSGTVEYISPNVDPGAHAVKIRTSIPNTTGKLKADMLVQGNLQIPPHPGYVVIPRIAMIVVDGRSYAFTRVNNSKDKFTRHRVEVVHEKEDRVVLRNGLKPGEEVVVLGSLIMQQLYEESDMLTSGRGSRSIGDKD